MSLRPDLKLDWCSHEAAKYAVEHWHYSRQLPPFPHARVGVWEGGQFIGCILFARGANRNLYGPYGLSGIEGAELVRVALRDHETPVSRMLSIAVRIVSREYSGLRLIVSFADPRHGHHGGVYQAAGWIYAGQTESSFLLIDRGGKYWHPRVTSPTGTKRAFGRIRRVPRPSECRSIEVPGKYRYLMPLDAEMRAKLAPLARPYPKRAGSLASEATPPPGREGGAIPTPALVGPHDGSAS